MNKIANEIIKEETFKISLIREAQAKQEKYDYLVNLMHELSENWNIEKVASLFNEMNIYVSNSDGEMRDIKDIGKDLYNFIKNLKDEIHELNIKILLMDV